MKSTAIILLSALILISCENRDTRISPAVDTTAATDTASVSLPYSMNRTSEWVPAGMNSVAIAMEALKGYEMNDSTAMAKHMADSISFYFEDRSVKGKDTVLSVIMNYRNNLDSLRIEMEDFKAVKDKNSSEEWVGLWYREISRNKKGQRDSAMVMDDIRIENGKITMIDSRSRKVRANTK